MNLNKLLLHTLLCNKRVRSSATTKEFTLFKHKSSKLVFKQHTKNGHIFSKKYFVTTNTSKRISNIPIDKVSPSDFASLNKHNNQVGIVYFKDNTHFVYVILKNEIVILSANGGSRGLISDSSTECSNGLLYINMQSDDYLYSINNPVQMLFGEVQMNKNNVGYYDLDQQVAMKKILKELPTWPDKADSDFIRNNSELGGKYMAVYDKQRNKLQHALKAFIFIHMANVIDKTFIPDHSNLTIKQRLKGQKTTLSDIIQINSFWDENIKVISPFSVSGHFRKQPFGKDRLKRRLIYIDSFMKTGYSRSAGILNQS